MVPLMKVESVSRKPGGSYPFEMAIQQRLPLSMVMTTSRGGGCGVWGSDFMFGAALSFGLGLSLLFVSPPLGLDSLNLAKILRCPTNLW